ncbi:hypothetical protein Tco_1036569 [Tanacetum coccineum]
MVFIMKMKILLEPSSNKLLEQSKMKMEIPYFRRVKLIIECSDTTYTCYEVMKDLIKVSKASAHSDIIYFFTSAQDGDISQDNERLYLADDLKKAQDHNQNKSK